MRSSVTSCTSDSRVNPPVRQRRRRPIGWCCPDTDGVAAIDHPIEVRPIAPDEWRRLRAIRLEALADAPEAFITTLSEAQAFADDVWIERAVAGTGEGDQLTMIAVDGDATVGLAVGLDRTSIAPGVVAIVSVFVSPSARRKGVADRMMAAIEEWARSRGATTTSLWVVDGNDAAREFYASLGYVPTLDRQKIRVPPVRWETRMVKDLRRG